MKKVIVIISLVALIAAVGVFFSSPMYHEIFRPKPEIGIAKISERETKDGQPTAIIVPLADSSEIDTGDVIDVRLDTKKARHFVLFSISGNKAFKEIASTQDLKDFEPTEKIIQFSSLPVIPYFKDYMRYFVVTSNTDCDYNLIRKLAEDLAKDPKKAGNDFLPLNYKYKQGSFILRESTVSASNLEKLIREHKIELKMHGYNFEEIYG